LNAKDSPTQSLFRKLLEVLARFSSRIEKARRSGAMCSG
jgi:hypothetical protein